MHCHHISIEQHLTKCEAQVYIQNQLSESSSQITSSKEQFVQQNPNMKMNVQSAVPLKLLRTKPNRMRVKRRKA